MGHHFSFACSVHTNSTYRRTHDKYFQENVAAESSMMVPDCERRLESAVADLQAAVDDCEDNSEELGEKGQELLSAAKDLLKE